MSRSSQSNVRTTIMVVDDEPLLTKALSKILSLHGYQVQTFEHPRQALEALKALSPDILVTDMSLPELDGSELARKVKAEHPRCGIILTSGAVETDVSKSLRLEWNDVRFLLKPVRSADLLTTIKELLGDNS